MSHIDLCRFQDSATASRALYIGNIMNLRPPLGVIPSEFGKWRVARKLGRWAIRPDGGRKSTIRLNVLIQYRSVSDRQTDGRTDGRNYCDINIARVFMNEYRTRYSG